MMTPIGGEALPFARGSRQGLIVVLRQLVRDLLELRVHASGDDGPVGIAAEEIHQHLLPDARQVDGPEPRSSPRMAHVDPAGAALIRLGRAVPVEVNAHPPELVDVDLLFRRSNHRRSLDAGDSGLRR